MCLGIRNRYLSKERPRKNLKKENTLNVCYYKTKKDLDHEMKKHRRDVLKKVAELYKKEKEEFHQKYRLFQLHKWEILKVIKQNMIKTRLLELQKAKMVRALIG